MQNNQIEEGLFTIVTFTGSDVSLYDSFLRFCNILIYFHTGLANLTCMDGIHCIRLHFLTKVLDYC